MEWAVWSVGCVEWAVRSGLWAVWSGLYGVALLLPSTRRTASPPLAPQVSTAAAAASGGSGSDTLSPLQVAIMLSWSSNCARSSSFLKELRV